MSVEQLNVLETVREVTDYVQVQLLHPSFTSLRFLRNLRLIQGRSTPKYVYIGPLSLAVPPWIIAMSNGGGFAHR